MPFRLSVVAGLLALFAFTAPATADPVEIHYAPVENLERVDVALLQSARSKIDLTAWRGRALFKRLRGICAFSVQLVASLLDFPIGVMVLRAAEFAQ